MRRHLIVSVLLVSRVISNDYSKWYETLTPFPYNPEIPIVTTEDALFDSTNFEALPVSSRTSPTSPSNSTTNSTESKIVNPSTPPKSRSTFDIIRSILNRYPTLTVLLVLLLVVTIFVLILLLVSLQCSRLAKNWKNTTNRISQLNEPSILRNPHFNPSISANEPSEVPYENVPFLSSHHEPSNHTRPSSAPPSLRLSNNPSLTNPNSFSTIRKKTDRRRVTDDDKIYEDVRLTEPSLPTKTNHSSFPPLPEANPTEINPFE